MLKILSKGSMYDVIVKRKEAVSWLQTMKMTRDAAAGILHLHCENVLVM